MKEMIEKAYVGATDQPSQAHNIIIYAGEQHCTVYREFLKYLEFEDLEKIEKSESKEFCINIKNFPPFFSYWPENFEIYDESIDTVETQKRKLEDDYEEQPYLLVKSKRKEE
jgi:hypothetical protein